MSKIIVQFRNNKGRFISQQMGWAAVAALGMTKRFFDHLNEMQEMGKEVPHLRYVLKFVCPNVDDKGEILCKKR